MVRVDLIKKNQLNSTQLNLTPNPLSHHNHIHPCAPHTGGLRAPVRPVGPLPWPSGTAGHSL